MRSLKASGLGNLTTLEMNIHDDNPDESNKKDCDDRKNDVAAVAAVNKGIDDNVNENGKIFIFTFGRLDDNFDDDKSFIADAIGRLMRG